MTDALANLKFDQGGGDFIRFKADQPIKIRVHSTNPVIHENTYTDNKTGEVSVSTKYTFAVWNYSEDRAMILDATPSIAKGISELHNDDDFGADITKLDVKITPTGEMLERRYKLDVLPQAQTLAPSQVEALEELDKKLDDIIKNGIRADEANAGKRPPVNKQPDEIVPVTDEPINLSDIPF